MNSFLQGKKTLSVAPLRPFASAIPSATASTAPAASTRSAPPPAQPNHSGPTVEVVKEGDKVVRLVVVCGCGERVEIECLYPAGS